MNKTIVWKFILMLLFVGYPATVFSADLPQSVLESEHFQPDHIGRQSPKDWCEVMNRVAQDGIFSSLGGEDRCYMLYAERVKGIVDQEYTNAPLLRESMYKTYHLLNHYLINIFTPGSFHADQRVEAEFEWLMLAGYRDKFFTNNPGNDIGDIRNIGIILHNTFFEVLGPEYVKKRNDNLAVLETAIDALKAAEMHMSEIEKKYFRKELVRYFGRFLGNK